MLACQSVVIGILLPAFIGSCQQEVKIGRSWQYRARRRQGCSWGAPLAGLCVMWCPTPKNRAAEDGWYLNSGTDDDVGTCRLPPSDESTSEFLDGL